MLALRNPLDTSRPRRPASARRGLFGQTGSGRRRIAGRARVAAGRSRSAGRRRRRRNAPNYTVEAHPWCASAPRRSSDEMFLPVVATNAHVDACAARWCSSSSVVTCARTGSSACAPGQAAPTPPQAPGSRACRSPAVRAGPADGRPLDGRADRLRRSRASRSPIRRSRMRSWCSRARS